MQRVLFTLTADSPYDPWQVTNFSNLHFSHLSSEGDELNDFCGSSNSFITKILMVEDIHIASIGLDLKDQIV